MPQISSVCVWANRWTGQLASRDRPVGGTRLQTLLLEGAEDSVLGSGTRLAAEFLPRLTGAAPQG
ncbi:hypothetical protein LWP59_17805 [Amycolatopsis acidiphila]|uniref:Uncharacterized protein n=1 Tax=Amycolatopsis acidiphila TaxID=715473 RepID=A0A558ANU8_9PSEU|nr:hypothetical protein [Amycolatopsis acidiphila]TVT25933.1 hypothetical protein FNH06_00410 [Amycolatopsis acidiphila]UIJ63359.1 hypothetical protein LWP59_17805 [Amycolatopsis acidiphila]GHG75161.1 hypothetical protein GCM10017788_39820 [Amycolatopsis acidiphila]